MICLTFFFCGFSTSFHWFSTVWTRSVAFYVVWKNLDVPSHVFLTPVTQASWSEKWNTIRGIFLLFIHEHLSLIYPSSQVHIWAASKLQLLFLSLCLSRYHETISPIALICHVWLCGKQKETAAGTFSSWVLSEKQLPLHLYKPPHIYYIVISQHQSGNLHTTTYFSLGLICLSWIYSVTETKGRDLKTVFNVILLVLWLQNL